MLHVTHYNDFKIGMLNFNMSVQNQQLPKDWVKLYTPNLYSYKGFIVRQIDHLGGKVELVAYGFEGKHLCVLTSDLESAMKEIEIELKKNS